MLYERSPSVDFRNLLKPSGPLNFLVSGFHDWVPNDPRALDPQFRKDDTLSFYHGLTSLMQVGLISQNGADQHVLLTADKAYSGARHYKLLMKEWPISSSTVADLKQLIPEYMSSAADSALDRYYKNQKEGFWQNQLSLSFGFHWKPGMDWLVVDREAMISYKEVEIQDRPEDAIRKEYQKVRDHLQNQDPITWGQPQNRSFGNKLDFLALGPTGELWCLELKHGADTGKIYWAQLQVATYRDLWRQAADTLLAEIRNLVEAKVEVGLLPKEALQRVPGTSDGFRCVLAAVVVAAPNEQSQCWQLSKEVLNAAQGLLDDKTAVDVPFFDVRSKEDPAPIHRVL